MRVLRLRGRIRVLIDLFLSFAFAEIFNDDAGVARDGSGVFGSAESKSTMSEVPNPDEVRATGDPGDDTARRFAYQYAYAGILVCSLLDDTSGIVEVFCEHHEDVLVKHSDGTFSGCQVKTRDLGGDPWRATDEPIVAALCRFARLEKAFPGKFRDFVIATNHTFSTGKKTKSDLPHLLKLAASATNETACEEKVKALLKRISRGASCAEAVALAALKKCRCDDSLPKLDGIKKELVSAIAEGWVHARELSYSLLRHAADELSAESGRASCLDHAQCLPGYLSAMRDGLSIANKAAIDGKRFDRARVETVLRQALDSPSLLAGPRTTAGPSASSIGLLETKLAAGGFSQVSVNSAKDLRDKADHQALEWLNRFGEKEGLERRDHIRSLVLRDCADAFEASKEPEETFGVRMLDELRQRLQRRREVGGATLFDCLNEHLEGYAFVLTGECRVVWSDPPPTTAGE
jgi:hypothetical protein